MTFDARSTGNSAVFTNIQRDLHECLEALDFLTCPYFYSDDEWIRTELTLFAAAPLCPDGASDPAATEETVRAVTNSSVPSVSAVQRMGDFPITVVLTFSLIYPGYPPWIHIRTPVGTTWHSEQTWLSLDGSVVPQHMESVREWNTLRHGDGSLSGRVWPSNGPAHQLQKMLIELRHLLNVSMPFRIPLIVLGQNECITLAPSPCSLREMNTFPCTQVCVVSEPLLFDSTQEPKNFYTRACRVLCATALHLYQKKMVSYFNQREISVALLEGLIQSKEMLDTMLVTLMSTQTALQEMTQKLAQKVFELKEIHSKIISVPSALQKLADVDLFFEYNRSWKVLTTPSNRAEDVESMFGQMKSLPLFHPAGDQTQEERRKGSGKDTDQRIFYTNIGVDLSASRSRVEYQDFFFLDNNAVQLEERDDHGSDEDFFDADHKHRDALLELVAEDRALEDTFDFVEDLLRCQVISCDVFVRCTADLARQQFMVRSLLNKISSSI